jgi:hypothetical protein
MENGNEMEVSEPASVTGRYRHKVDDRRRAKLPTRFLGLYKPESEIVIARTEAVVFLDRLKDAIDQTPPVYGSGQGFRYLSVYLHEEWGKAYNSVFKALYALYGNSVPFRIDVDRTDQNTWPQHIRAKNIQTGEDTAGSRTY